MGGFGYHPEITVRFPSVRGAVVHATGLINESPSDTLQHTYGVEQRRVIEQIGDAPLSAIPSLEAWRRTFSAFGVKPTQYRSAAEALLRRLTKQGDIPSINPLVDLANLVSIRYRLPVAVCDQRPVTGVTTVRFATGEERFTDLGSGTTSHPEPGEVVFVDDAQLASARRWCWRQSAESAAGPDTVEAIFTIEAQHDEAENDVRRATNDLLELLVVFQAQAEISHGFLSPDSPWFTFGAD
jgi:DNA/RNA-binding domain of Phe-tRNA-synthetase-like protein